MTVGDYPEYLAVGYLVNQNILKDIELIQDVEVLDDIDTVIVRTTKKINFEVDKKKEIKTSGCAQGTIFDNIIEEIEEIEINSDFCIMSEDLFKLYKNINLTPSLYLKSGAIHGCVLCDRTKELAFFEDVGRHNAIDKLAGYMFLNKINPDNKILYTTGRLTSEMVIKTILMRIPILASRSGYTAWGVDLAQKSNITMLGRLRGKNFKILSGKDRLK